MTSSAYVSGADGGSCSAALAADTADEDKRADEVAAAPAGGFEPAALEAAAANRGRLGAATAACNAD